MATQEELVKYIEKGLRQHFNIDYIKEVLVQHGHDVNRVNEAVKIVRDIKHPAAIDKHLEKLKIKKTPSNKVHTIVTIFLVLIIIILVSTTIKNKMSEKEIESTLEEVSKLSSIIDEKQDLIDKKIKEIEDLDINDGAKEELIQQQLDELKALNEYIKEERTKTRDLLLELMGFILKK